MNRREAREAAFQLIYEMGFHKDEDYLEVYSKALSTRELEDNAFTREIFSGVYENTEKIDHIITEFVHGWKLERLSSVTLSILRLSIYEMIVSAKVPMNVSINEAVELAKKFDDDDAPAFINGILNKAAKEYGVIQ